jgi:hypothetical protein
MKRFLILARKREVVVRAGKTALIVGTLLTFINQGDALIAGQLPNGLKLLLTYLVPYGVSTHGAVTAMRDHSRRKARQRARS